ncbi:unnamed protein product [Heligmosomoides polygyrus]|uniref:Uncharacterized protein n=1 Tax=Heligmosomoides polygyrus TaxID=6339 RepID=A0A183GVJ0_HELPZ|nr:unnamed protein product [Heligmosomoides polygyrus]
MMREVRLRWYDHVLRGKEDSVRKIGLELEVSGKRSRGRPKQRWSDTLHMDMKVIGVHPDEAQDEKGGVVTPEERTPRRSGANAEEEEEEEEEEEDRSMCVGFLNTGQKSWRVCRGAEGVS